MSTQFHLLCQCRDVPCIISGLSKYFLPCYCSRRLHDAFRKGIFIAIELQDFCRRDCRVGVDATGDCAKVADLFPCLRVDMIILDNGGGCMSIGVVWWWMVVMWDWLPCCKDVHSSLPPAILQVSEGSGQPAPWRHVLGDGILMTYFRGCIRFAREEMI